MSSSQVVALRPEVFSDPVALRAELGGAPVHRVTLPDGMPAWLVTGNDEVRQTLSDPRIVRSVEAAAPELHQYLGLASGDFKLTRHMLFADPPVHTRLRKLVSKAFSARRIERLRPRVRQITDELLDRIVEDGQADLVSALALPLPIAVICELLGVPYGDRDEFERHAETITGVNSASSFEDVITAGQWFDTYIGGLVTRRRGDLGDDMISAMIAAQEHDDQLTDVEVRSNAFLLLAAGFETTVNLVANGLLALLRHPGVLREVRDDPSLVPATVEELLRYDSPVSSVTYRFAREPVEIGGQRIEAGEHIAVSLPCANHDPSRFGDAARLDVHRRTSAHLSFGHGIHFCLGAPLARIEGQVAVGRVLARLRDLRLAVPARELTWKPTFIVHRLDRLPVEFTKGTKQCW